VTRGKYDGAEYVPEIDDPRLDNQHERVKAAMVDGRWRTLAEIERLTGDPPASISAQLRHLRKPRFGAWTIERQPRGDRSSGLFEYRLLAPKEDTPAPTKKMTLKQKYDALREQIEELEEENMYLYRRIEELEARLGRSD
jgi:hypothetical protein